MKNLLSFLSSFHFFSYYEFEMGKIYICSQLKPSFVTKFHEVW